MPLGLLGSLYACDGSISRPPADGPPDDTGTVTDADADADADSDADADLDTAGTGDTGVEPPPPYDCYAEYAFDAPPIGSPVMDGVPDTVGYDGYDPTDTTRLLRAERDGDRLDGLPDGTVDVVETTTWDPAGDPVGFEVDAPPGDPIEYFEDRTYDANGARLVLQADCDPAARSGPACGDGLVDHVETDTRDGSGLLLQTDVDLDADTVVDTILAWTYDPQGRVVEHRRDEGADGTFEVVETTTWPDPYALSGTTDVDLDDDGDVDEVRAFELTANGDLLTETTTTPVGLYDTIETVTRTYDASGRLLEHAYTFSLGPPYGGVLYEQSETWTFGGTCP